MFEFDLTSLDDPRALQDHFLLITLEMGILQCSRESRPDSFGPSESNRSETTLKARSNNSK